MKNALALGTLVFLLVATNAALALADETPAAGPDKSEENSHLWKPQTKSVAVFKNGLGFFMREGEVALRDGWCLSKQIPPAAFGTLAIYSHDDESTVDIVGSGKGEIVEFDDVDAASDTATKRARLEASLNLKLEIAYKHKGQDRTAAGKLVSVGPEFAVLDTGSNSFAVPVAGVQKMQVLELPLRVHVTGEKEETPEKATLGMAYLRKGITWIPDYTLKIIDEETAQLTLRGTVVNEAEDLIHTDVHLVVGVPHFVHTDYMAPIAVGQVIRTIGSAVAPQQVTSQIMNRAAIVSNGITAPQFSQPVERPVGGEHGNLSGAVGNLPQMGGAAATDYTVYTKEDLTLRRGEKAIITLFTKTIKYSHIYRWNTSSRMQHFLVLHNQTDSAWTTGPCLAVDGQQPLSEDLLKYTPKKGNAELPMTTAINIAHEKTERETDRKLKAYNVHTTYYDLVSLEGKLQLKNFEKRAVRIVVTSSVAGKPIEATADGAISVDATKLTLTQRAGRVSWVVDLKPDESKVLTFQYERYVKSQ